MKSLYETIFDDDSIFQDIDNSIMKFINDNYQVLGSITIKNGLVDVNGDIILINDVEYLTNDLFNFGVVTGTFDCHNKWNLKSLKGSPIKVNHFNCSETKITTLEGAPEEVETYFNCSFCYKITTLEGAPKKVEKFICCGCEGLTSLEGSPKECYIFDCSYCAKLKDLKGAPQKVKYDFICSACRDLTSLKGSPKEVGGNFTCSTCHQLKDLKGSPKKVGGNFKCSSCKSLKSLKGIGEVSGEIISDLQL